MTKENTTCGKWTDPFVPKVGWECDTVLDVGQDYQTCQMCERAQIRYVHIMSHKSYKEKLEVGCICAGKMEQDSDNAAYREKRFIAKEKAKKNWEWMDWKQSAKQNWYVNKGGFNIVCVWCSNQYRGTFFFWRITDKETNESWKSVEFDKLEDCKMSAFEYFWKHKEGRNE